MLLINRFEIGCDPEVIALDANNRGIALGGVLPNEGRVGYDHGGHVGEVRPAPTRNTWTLVKNIRELLARTRWEKVKGLTKLRAGGGGEWDPWGRVTLGGHIHVNIDPEQHYDEDKDGYVYSLAHRARIEALDALTRQLEGLDILPQKESTARRTGNYNGYGKWGDFRVKYAPGHSRFEYRTMASWLYSPTAAFTCLTGAKIAAAFPKESTELLRCKPNFGKLQEFFLAFSNKDINAKRMCEQFLTRGVKGLTANPDVDCIEEWEKFNALAAARR